VTPLAASILGYFLGLATGAFLVAIVLVMRGGRDVRDHDRRRDDQAPTIKRRDW
jgi:hypothetical protein